MTVQRYREKKSYTDLYPHLNVIQDVQQIIFACDHPAVKAKRVNFLARSTKYVKSFDVKPSRKKLRELLNLDPSCAAGCKEPAQKHICAFTDQVYTYVNVTLMSNKQTILMVKCIVVH